MSNPKKHCLLCDSGDHYTVTCPGRTIKADLTISEWLNIYLLRKFGTLSEAAKHYRVTQSAIYMALAGKRPIPMQLLNDAGIRFHVSVSQE